MVVVAVLVFHVHIIKSHVFQKFFVLDIDWFIKHIFDLLSRRKLAYCRLMKFNLWLYQVMSLYYIISQFIIQVIIAIFIVSSSIDIVLIIDIS